MNPKLVLFLLSLFFINTVISQTIHVKNKQFIITNSGDTIKGINIFKKKRYCNRETVKYTDIEGITHNANANQIKLYFDGKKIFKSVEIPDKNKKNFIHFFSDGYMKAGESYTKKNTVIYYLLYKNKLITLEKYRYNLNSFLNNTLEKFDSFTSSYKKRIYYDYKSIGEMTAAYNAFLFPEKYVPTKYKYKHFISLGITATPLYYSNIYNEKEIPLNHNNSFQSGLVIKYDYTRNISFSLIPSLYKSSFSSDISKLEINSVNTDLLLNITAFRRNKNEIIISSGTSIMYHYNTFLYTNDIFNGYQNVTYNLLSSGFILKASYGYNKHLYVNLGIHFFHIWNNTKHTGYFYYPVTNYIREVGVGFSYMFNRKEVILK